MMIMTTPERHTLHDRRIGPYLLERPLGRGSHGEVYLARHKSGTDGPVAIKMLVRGANLNQLLVEPMLLSRLRHPNIVQLIDYFIEGTWLALVMRYTPSIDLETYIHKNGPLPASEVRLFLLQMAQALALAHSNGILHRDIKPSNVLVQTEKEQTRFILTDFSVATMATGIQFKRRVGGTYYFMAPEQLRGRPDRQSDLWALGVVAYLMLTGSRPFGGNTIEDLSREIYYRSLPPPSRIRSNGDQELDLIVLRLLEKQLECRTASPEELLTELCARPESAPPRPLRSPGAATKSLTFMARLRSRLLKVRLAALGAGLVSFLPACGPGCILMLLGLSLLYKSHRRNTPSAVKALIVMAIGEIITEWWSMDILSRAGPSIWLTLTLTLLLSMATTPICAYYIMRQRRMARELRTLEALENDFIEPKALLQFMRELVQDHPGDVSLHQRYAEMLFALGHVNSAVVEARLILMEDRYNVGAILLLIHGYFQMNLHRSCVETCDAYLLVFGYSFELTSMRVRSIAALAE